MTRAFVRAEKALGSPRIGEMGFMMKARTTSDRG